MARIRWDRPDAFDHVLLLGGGDAREFVEGFWRALMADHGSRISYYQEAAIYAELKDMNKVFECLTEATAVPLEKPLSADPRFDGIRTDPRYVKLLQELGW